MEPLNRRELFVGAAAAGMIGVVGCSTDSTDQPAKPSVTTTGVAAQPAAKDAPFDTVVVLMME
ncbi:MAG TPA: hypothetical protein VFN21_04750, partial [Acidimicrobiales bacterium]|nr:hypothetical protein [Acidimicrobiales bacterium]